MTKKHFIALADALQNVRPLSVEAVDLTSFYQQGVCAQWKRTVIALADFCASQNSRFNRQLWLDYIAGKCGSNGGKV